MASGVRRTSASARRRFCWFAKVLLRLRVTEPRRKRGGPSRASRGGGGSRAQTEARAACKTGSSSQEAEGCQEADDIIASAPCALVKLLVLGSSAKKFATGELLLSENFFSRRRLARTDRIAFFFPPIILLSLARATRVVYDAPRRARASSLRVRSCRAASGEARFAPRRPRRGRVGRSVDGSRLGRVHQRPVAFSFFVHIHVGLRHPLLHTGMQLHTGRYARLLYTASPLPSLRFLRQWYSLGRSGAGAGETFARAIAPGGERARASGVTRAVGFAARTSGSPGSPRRPRPRRWSGPSRRRRPRRSCRRRRVACARVRVSATTARPRRTTGSLGGSDEKNASFVVTRLSDDI